MENRHDKISQKNYFNKPSEDGVEQKLFPFICSVYWYEFWGEQLLFFSTTHWFEQR